MGKTGPCDFFQIYRPISFILPPILSAQGDLHGEIPENRFFCDNFWLECPTDLRSTCLSYIFRALFRDTPLGHVRRTLPNIQIAKYLIFGYGAVQMVVFVTLAVCALAWPFLLDDINPPGTNNCTASTKYRFPHRKQGYRTGLVGTSYKNLTMHCYQ